MPLALERTALYLGTLEKAARSIAPWILAGQRGRCDDAEHRSLRRSHGNTRALYASWFSGFGDLRAQNISQPSVAACTVCTRVVGVNSFITPCPRTAQTRVKRVSICAKGDKAERCIIMKQSVCPCFMVPNRGKCTPTKKGVVLSCRLGVVCKPLP